MRRLPLRARSNRRSCESDRGGGRGGSLAALCPGGQVSGSTRRSVYLLRLRPLPNVDGTRMLRAAIKTLLRKYQLQALEIHEIADDTKGDRQCPEHPEKSSPNRNSKPNAT